MIVLLFCKVSEEDIDVMVDIVLPLSGDKSKTRKDAVRYEVSSCLIPKGETPSDWQSRFGYPRRK